MFVYPKDSTYYLPLTKIFLLMVETFSHITCNYVLHPCAHTTQQFFILDYLFSPKKKRTRDSGYKKREADKTSGTVLDGSMCTSVLCSLICVEFLNIKKYYRYFCGVVLPRKEAAPREFFFCVNHQELGGSVEHSVTHSLTLVLLSTFFFLRHTRRGREEGRK